MGEIPARLLTDECPRYEVEQRAESRPVRQPEPPEFDVGEVIEQYDHLVGSRTVRRPGLDARRPAPAAVAARARGRAARPRAGRDRRLPRAASRRPWAPRATSRAPAASRSGSPTASTSAIPRSPSIAHELAQAIEGIAQAAEALGIPVVSGNVSLYNDADGASIPPTPVVGCVGLVPDVRRVPGRWQSGDARSPRDVARRLARGRGGADPLPLEGGARISASATTSATGGIAAALAEAAAWSGGLEADVELPADYDSRRGAAILACRPARVNRLGSRGFVEIGVVA